MYCVYLYLKWHFQFQKLQFRFIIWNITLLLLIDEPKIMHFSRPECFNIKFKIKKKKKFAKTAI